MSASKNASIQVTTELYSSPTLSYSQAQPLFENQIPCEWLSTFEAARYLGITPNALRICVHRGQVCAYKFGRRLRFRAEELRQVPQKKGTTPVKVTNSSLVPILICSGKKYLSKNNLLPSAALISVSAGGALTNGLAGLVCPLGWLVVAANAPGRIQFAENENTVSTTT
jgi:excisionase family DNA binding protein